MMLTRKNYNQTNRQQTSSLASESLSPTIGKDCASTPNFTEVIQASIYFIIKGHKAGICIKMGPKICQIWFKQRLIINADIHSLPSTLKRDYQLAN
jgi:hypothetical protein